MRKVGSKNRLFGLPLAYKVTKIGKLEYKVVNLQRYFSYVVEKKPKTFAKSGKTYIIWQCSCPSYKNWAWKSHSCKHIDMLRDMGEIK